MIGKWGGVPLRTFLEQSGADLSASYVAFYCDDPISYKTSIDVRTALHPQTILCLTYADKPLAPKFGAPMRDWFMFRQLLANDWIIRNAWLIAAASIFSAGLFQFSA